MNNKVLVEVIVPHLEERYQVYIPIRKRISVVIKLLEKAKTKYCFRFFNHNT